MSSAENPTSSTSQAEPAALTSLGAGEAPIPSNEEILRGYASRSRYRLPDGLSLWRILGEDYRAHGRDWTLPGFRAVAVQRFGVWIQGVRFAPARVALFRLYTSLYRRVRNHYGIEISYTVSLGRRVIIEHQSGIIIHGFSVIGDDCILRQGVTLGIKSTDRPFDAPILGKKVDVGAGAKLLGRIELGDQVRVGANAVVVRSVPAGATVAGIPAKIIKQGGAPK